MRKGFWVYLLATLIVPLAASSKQYKVMFSDNYPPFNYCNEKGELVGFNIDILKAVTKLYDVDVQLEHSDWKTINEILDKGDIDGIGGAHFPGTPNNEYFYTRSVFSNFHSFLYNPNQDNDFSLEHFRLLQNPIVGMWKNDILANYILSINPSSIIKYAKSNEELVNMMKTGEISFILGQYIVIKYYADKLSYNIAPIEYKILERQMGYKISKNSPELTTMINNGLEVIIANGEYEKIYNKWLAKYNELPSSWVNRYLKYILFFAGIILLSMLVLAFFNYILKKQVRNKTKALRNQLKLNEQIMEELEKQKNKALDSERMKSAFLANMSHEIRTPMNGILGFAEILRNEDSLGIEEQRNFLEIIEKNGHRMLETINNIITVSKLEAGMDKVVISKIDIKKLFFELYSFFKKEATDKNLNLILEESIYSTDGSFFYTDSYKLNSILTNLIKNAIKFTKKGSIKIKYKLQDEKLEFWIIDTGIGIAKEKHDLVFEQFMQADISHTREFEGSGLGLSISNGYTKMLNGEMFLFSELGEGSTFYASIPNNEKTDDNSFEGATDDAVKDITPPRKLKVLIAEDDETSYILLEQNLKKYCSKIIRAYDGLQATKILINTEDIDAIIMDVKMPTMTGIEATKEIRKFNKDIYIVAQSAFVQENFIREAKKAGCNDYVEKPIDITILKQLLTKAIKEKDARDAKTAIFWK